MPSEATSSNNSPLAAVATEGLPITPLAETSLKETQREIPD